MNKQLKGFTLLRRLKLKSDNDYALLFKNDNGTYKISAWTSVWTVVQSHSVVINEIIPNSAIISAMDGKGNVLKLKTSNGSLVVDLKELPQYITLPGGTRMD
jgi:hypothetical protein